MAVAVADANGAAETIRVRGIVQGVGFRPTVYRLARAHGLRGSVRNDGQGVCIVVSGMPARIDAFVTALQQEPPPLARIDAVERRPCAPPPATDFRIEPSSGATVRTGVSPDAATCDACLHELFGVAGRRAGHPFVNCTDCGPRYSIVRSLPYDRPRTSMAAFAMCDDCRREYDEPRDRRFHAQPIACLQCGPRLRFDTGEAQQPADGIDDIAQAVQHAVEALRAGRIVAVKGVGGYQLACDARSEVAVARLRSRKRRPSKPFALLGRDLAMIDRHALTSEAERALLGSPAAPIVLLAADGPQRLAAGVAPGQRTLGFMLPQSPLHHLLMARLDAPIVLTSGNAVDEPQCIADADARERLGAIADAWLLHDRAIVHRVDDSVVRVVGNAARVLRRGRGLAPASLPLPSGFEAALPVLALGGELKSAICLLQDGHATLSQHLGDLHHPRAHAAFVETVAWYERLYSHAAEVIAIDRHPDYRAARFGRERATEARLELVEVQHHHAHIAACMAEHGVQRDTPPVLGIVLDGLGYGDDGTLWGFEFLRADYAGFDRLASLRPVAMPGGAQAIREPWRMAWSQLAQHPESAALLRAHAGLPVLQRLRERPIANLAAMQRAGINSPQTSSCGRLFDAVAALIGVGDEAGYEGQPAIELEAVVDLAAFESDAGYAFLVDDAGIDPAPMWSMLLDDLSRAVPAGVAAARFHRGLIDAIAAMVRRLTDGVGEAPWRPRIVLSGGVFQNALLLAELPRRLAAEGHAVLTPQRVPANDGGLALGQALIAAAQSTMIGPVTKAIPCASASPAR
ncbi:MAG: carbamoyltransferase HypF [Burkholderiaceae bacterium]